MDGANRSAIRAYAALSSDLLDLIAKDYPLYLFADTLPVLERQPDPVWAGDPVASRYATKQMCTLLPIAEDRFHRNPNVHGSPIAKGLP